LQKGLRENFSNCVQQQAVSTGTTPIARNQQSLMFVNWQQQADLH